ncbi:porin family protein [Pontibacter sp. G13]|uniref:type IX secretion/gliding motility protein PorT/SprT n=1 Tax=Pontibacter sp. G13 TaxID=3074898 RepID=UPI002889C199|nr:porin family protein [Pontibacter sp. G13]WNJ19567.1 porin family protein [Pontibacter sp. G13]
MLRRVSKALLTMALAVVFAQPLHAQFFGNHRFDQSRFNLGFLVGMAYNSYNLNEEILVEDDGILLKRIELVPKYGIRLGLITNFKINKRVAFRFIPSVSLEERDFNYVFQGSGNLDSTAIRKISTTYFNLPLLVQIKTGYYKRTRFYVMTGIQPSINLQSTKKVVNNLDLLKISDFDLALVFGAGLNLYGDKVKLSPEIYYSLGLIDIYEPQFTTHANAIQRLSTQTLSLVINFE